MQQILAPSAPGPTFWAMSSPALHPDRWLKPPPAGLYCEPADLFIDPTRRVDRAVITHGHSDHARPGHRRGLATRETPAFMAHRHGDETGLERQALSYGEAVRINDVTLRLNPAGHILGSARVVLEYGG